MEPFPQPGILLQLFHDFRQFLISVKTPAYSQMKANRMKTLQKIIDIFCHKDIITVHILKKKQRLTAIKIQIEERTAKLFPDLKGNLITGRIKKSFIRFNKNCTVPLLPDRKIHNSFRFLLSMEEGEWEIYEAANGKLALNELRKHPVDLMLTDIKMPHMDGLELSKKAREEYPDLEIIIFSGLEILLLHSATAPRQKNPQFLPLPSDAPDLRNICSPTENTAEESYFLLWTAALYFSGMRSPSGSSVWCHESGPDPPVSVHNPSHHSGSPPEQKQNLHNR